VPPGELPNVLFVCHRTPFPPDKGDRIRTYNVLHCLAKRARVDVATLSDEPAGKETERELRKLARSVEIVPIGRRIRWVRAAASIMRGKSATEGLFCEPELRRRINRLTSCNEYDLVVIVCSGMLQYLERAQIGRAKVLVDLIDVDSEKWADYASQTTGWRRLAYLLEARRVRQLESKLADQGIPAAVVSDEEVRCYRKFQPTGHVIAVRNGVDFDFFHSGDAARIEPNSCVFVGALDYKPNVDGVAWFCESIWPQVRESNPQARFTIVGRRPVASVLKLGRLPGVRVVADVADVRPYLWNSSVVVAPLRIARGVQNKVLEALATGKPVIASRRSIEGLQVVVGEHLYQADSPTEWLEAISTLWGNEAERQRLGAAARALACANYGWNQALQPIAAILQEAFESRKAASR
jgi:sugar transferase (PEP-CTERM/EpsH1 system associated)